MALSRDIPWGEVILYGAVALAGLEIVKGIDEAISQNAQQATEAAGQGAANAIKSVSGAISTGLEDVGRALVSDWYDLTGDNNAQDLLNPEQGDPGGTGTQTGPPLGPWQTNQTNAGAATQGSGQ